MTMHELGYRQLRTRPDLALELERRPRRGWGRHVEGFDESLRLLIVVQEYSLTDVALMFGLSRERIRQHCTRLGFYDNAPRKNSRGMNAVRVWNDATNQFEPVSRGAIARQARRREAAARDAAREAERQAQWDHAVQTVRDLRADLGRNPTLLEVARAVGFTQATQKTGGGFLAGYLGKVRLGLSYRETYAKLYREADAAVRSQGGSGHLDREHGPATHCPTHGTEYTPATAWKTIDPKTTQGFRWLCKACDYAYKKRRRDQRRYHSHQEGALMFAQCKCGKLQTQTLEPDAAIPPCVGCADCGTTLARSAATHQALKAHDIKTAIRFDLRSGIPWTVRQCAACGLTVDATPSIEAVSDRKALEDVAMERARQVGKGWTAESDDRQDLGQLAWGAVAKILASKATLIGEEPSGLWPWPLAEGTARATPFDGTPRSLLVDAAAMLIAEIGRIDRLAAKAQEPAP